MISSGTRRRMAILLGPFIGLLLAGTLLPAGAWGTERVLLLLFLETALLALFAPATHCALVVVPLVGAGALAAVTMAALGGDGHVGAAALAHLLLLTWAGALATATRVARRPLGDRAGALVVMGLGLALVLLPFGLDPILDALGPGALRAHTLHVALLLNPPASLSLSLFEYDWIRAGSLYASTRFVSTDTFFSPSWAASTAVFGVAWAFLFVADRVLGRKGSPGSGVEEKDAPSRGPGAAPGGA